MVDFWIKLEEYGAPKVEGNEETKNIFAIVVIVAVFRIGMRSLTWTLEGAPPAPHLHLPRF
jgi:hypothetical protein